MKSVLSSCLKLLMLSAGSRV